MLMNAKFPGKCRACNGFITVGERIEYQRGLGATHADPKRCVAAREAAKVAAENSPKLSLQPIIDFLDRAKAKGLKSPRLRVIALDGSSEMVISITKGGMAPGSIAVAVGPNFAGCIRPNGQLTGSLQSSTLLQEYLVKIAQDPISAAKSYAALTGNCMFCGKKLEDDGSVEVGYGPVCADRYGLPHKPQGVRTLTQV